MKTKIQHLFIGLCLAVAALSGGGCQSVASFSKQLDALDASGVTAVEITGKFSHTEYSRRVVDGKTVSTFEHTNAWVPKVRLVREK